MTLNQKYVDWLTQLIQLNKDKRNFEVSNACNTNLFSNNIQEIISEDFGMSQMRYALAYPFVLMKNLRIVTTTFIFLLKLLILRDKKRAATVKSNNGLQLLVDIYIPRKSIHEGIWFDRMYNRAFSFLPKEKVGYVLTIDFVDDLTSLSKLIKSCPGTLLFPIDYLSLNDIIKVFIAYLFPPIISWPQNLLSSDVNRFVRLDLKRNRYHRSVFLGLLNKLYIKRMTKISNFEKFIVWHENRCQDRGFISGLRRYNKGSTVIAYQGYLVCRTRYNGYFPNMSDLLLGTAPHVVYVDGMLNVNIAMKNACNIEFKQGPSLRFLVNKHEQGKIKGDTILVLLPMDLLMSRRIIAFVFRSVNQVKKVKFRFHPLTNRKKLLYLFDRNPDIRVELSSAILEEDIKSAFIAIGSNTSALIESYALGVPCISVIMNNKEENIFNTNKAPHTYLFNSTENAEKIIDEYAKMEDKMFFLASKDLQIFANLNYMTKDTEKIVKEMIL